MLFNIMNQPKYYVTPTNKSKFEVMINEISFLVIIALTCL